MYLTPKNKEVEKAFDRLLKFPVIRIDPKLSQSISRYREIRYLREKDNIFIGRDHVKGKSIIFISPSVKLKKNNGKFFFGFK